MSDVKDKVVVESDDVFDGSFDIPGMDPDAVAPDGVDAAASDDGCASGACKI